MIEYTQDGSKVDHGPGYANNAGPYTQQVSFNTLSVREEGILHVRKGVASGMRRALRVVKHKGS